MKSLLILLFALISVYANEMQYNRGEMLYFSKVCNGCHGPSAEGGSSAPRLSNKKQIYLKNRLYYFRRAKVSSQTQEVMVQFSVKLSDQEIEDISYFLDHHKKSNTEAVSSELLGGFGS